MSTANRSASAAAARTAPLMITRVIAAPRALVFAAWSSAEHLKHWFCPAGFSIPQAEVEFRVGGVLNLCTRSPTGDEHWMRGRYLEIVTPSRLVFETEVSAGGEPTAPGLFRAHTTVLFAEQGAATRLEISQSYSLLQAQAAPMIEGAAQGWKQTLDRLEQEVARMRSWNEGAASGAPSGSRHEALKRSALHSTFRIERTYSASPAQVYHALTDPAAKARWFTGGEGFTLLARSMDVRAGGRERLQGRWAAGSHRAAGEEGPPQRVVTTPFDAVYLDVVAEQRLVYAYEMHLDQRKISASLATVELEPVGSDTRLVVTEQGAFLDGYDDAGARERGTRQLLEALGRSLTLDRP